MVSNRAVYRRYASDMSLSIDEAGPPLFLFPLSGHSRRNITIDYLVKALRSLQFFDRMICSRKR